MNAPALRRSLRYGGWDALARRLPSYLLEHGVPCTRVYRGRRFRFDTDPETGALTCALIGARGDRTIADEARCHVSVRDISLRTQRADNRVLSFCMAPSLHDALTRRAAATGRSKSELIRRALAAYLGASS